MSLHLIESRKVAATSSRRRDGLAISVTVHALLIVSTFTVATASPLHQGPRERDIIYNPPPPLRTELKASSEPAGFVVKPPAAFQQVWPSIPIPPVDIPDLITDMDLNHELLLIEAMPRRSSRTTSASNGAGTEPGTGGTVGVVVHNESQVEKTVAIRSGYRTPRYPEALRAAGIEQTLNVEFVVDTLGRIESGSLTFRESPHPSFMNAVREALANARFEPAEAAGHRVRQRVMQAFVFSLSKNE
jgi:TonB family protein